MPDYPNNSYDARERSQEQAAQKKLEKVVNGGAKTRKKRDIKKLFASENAADIKNYILMDVVIPGVKNAIADVVSIVLYGEAGKLGRARGSGKSKISYHRYYDRDDRTEYCRPRLSDGFDYDDILFETRGDADVVLDGLIAAIEQYQNVSVADLYDLSGITCRNHAANKYGWVDLRGAKVVRVRDGYILQLPRTVQL